MNTFTRAPPRWSKRAAGRAGIAIAIAIAIVEAVGVRDERREQLQQPFGDANDGVTLAKFQKGPWTTAVFRRRCASATDTHGVAASQLGRQDPLDSDIVLPAIDEVVFVLEALADAQPQINESYAARIATSVRAVHPSMSAPGHSHIQSVGYGATRANNTRVGLP